MGTDKKNIKFILGRRSHFVHMVCTNFFLSPVQLNHTFSFFPDKLLQCIHVQIPPGTAYFMFLCLSSMSIKQDRLQGKSGKISAYSPEMRSQSKGNLHAS